MNIVILDDSLTVRMIVESFLEDLGVEDDEMHSFALGNDALDYIEKHGVDLIFSDINMPYMDGYEFATKLFKKRNDLKKSFFAISGDESRKSYKKMKESGVHRFIKKPIDMKFFNHFIKPEISKIRIMEELLR